MAKGGKGGSKTLGRGLSALLGDIEEAAEETAGAPGTGGTAEIPIELIHPNPEQPRRRFDAAELEELAASLRERGVIQPVVLRPHPEKTQEYQIVAGERRWRAAQMAQLHALPAVVRDIDDQLVLEIAIVENVQRQGLDPLEEAEGYRQLIDRFGYTQEALSRVIGKSRSHLANTLRLLALPERVRELLAEGKLSAGHARALLSAPAPITLAERIVIEGLSVRQTEAIARKGVTIPGTGMDSSRAGPRKPEKDADTRMLEGDLSAAIGMRTEIVALGDGAGEVRIRYKSFEDLDRLCEKLAT